MPPFALPRWDTGVKRSSSCVQSSSGTAVIALIGVIAAGSSVKGPGCSSRAFPFLPKSSQGATFTAQFFAMGNCFGSRGNSIAPLRPILSNTQPATWAPCPKGWAQGCAKVGSGCSIFTNGTTFWSRRERASASSLRVALFWHSSLYPENNTTCRLPRGAPRNAQRQRLRDIAAELTKIGGTHCTPRAGAKQPREPASPCRSRFNLCEG